MENVKSYEELKDRLNGMLGEMNDTENNTTSDVEKKELEYRTAFWDAMHTGMLKNSLKEGSDGSGGHLVPDTYDDRLAQALAEENVLRKISTVIKTKYKLKIPAVVKDGDAQWVIEGQPVSFSDSEFGKIEIDAFKLGTTILLSDELLEDSGFDLPAYIEKAFSERNGSCEEEAFINGDGQSKPLGLIHQVNVGAVSKEVGKLTVDDIIDLSYSVKKQHRDSGVWLMSEGAYTALAKIWLYDGRQFLYSNNKAEGGTPRLFGRPVMVSKYLDDVAPGSKPILFGDFKHYWIGDRGKRSIKRLNERYADHGQVGFLTTQRVDAKLVLPEAIKALQIRA